MSTPTHRAMITRATVSLTPGMRRQPLGRLAKRAQHLVGLPLQFLQRRRVAHRSAARCRSSRKRWCGVTSTVHRGDDVRAVGLHPDVGAIGQPLAGSVSPAMSAVRIARPAQRPGCRVITRVTHLHVRVLERLLQALCCAVRSRGPVACAVRVRSPQLLDRGRRGTNLHGPNQLRAPTDPLDPGRVVPAPSLASAVPSINVPDVLRVGEHQCRTDDSSLEDVPHRLPVHAGRLHRHRNVQPASVEPRSASSSRPAVVVANCADARPWLFRPAAMRTHAFTRREWTSNPAHRGSQDFHFVTCLYRKALAWTSAGTKSKSRDPLDPPGFAMRGARGTPGPTTERESRHR